jgi:2-phospho-L-lactate guanylyltransferase (CobY/MobA/RfbA family)
MLKPALICATLAMLAGCATSLTDAAGKVQIVTAAQKEKCQTMKLVTVNQRLGPDKPGNAMKSALNEAAAAGGNAFYVVSTSLDWAEGASVVGEALRCGG